MHRSKHPKTVLIMDEIDGMSAGDRGGVADLIASIKITKVPITCICNDRYSLKLKSLVNYCLLLSFRKPMKQQMAKRLMQIANAEGLLVNEISLEELAESEWRYSHGYKPAAILTLSMSVVKYDDIRQRLLSSAKDEDISPFAAVDKLFGFNGGKLRMDERIDLNMSDPDLVPLLIQVEAVKKVVEFMNVYSISQQDFDTIVELSKFQGHANPLEGIPTAVKAALTRTYNEDCKSRIMRAADLVKLPGKKKAPKKRIAAILEPSDGIREENGDTLAESEEENSMDTEEADTTNGEKLQSELQSLNSKGVQVQVELKGTENSSAKKKPAGQGKGGSASAEKKGERRSGTVARRKR